MAFQRFRISQIKSEKLVAVCEAKIPYSVIKVFPFRRRQNQLSDKLKKGLFHGGYGMHVTSFHDGRNYIFILKYLHAIYCVKRLKIKIYKYVDRVLH